MADQLEPDFRDIERARDLPPDELGKVRAELHDDPFVSDADYGAIAEDAAQADERAAWEAEKEPPEPPSPYEGAMLCVKDALSYLEEPDPEAALHSLEEARARIERAM